MKILCNECGKSASTEVPDNTIIRAWVQCPECIEKRVDERQNLLAMSAQLYQDGHCTEQEHLWLKKLVEMKGKTI